MRDYSMYDAIRRRREFEESMRDKGEEVKAKMAEVAAHPETVVIARSQMPDPWVYVEVLFPRIATAISATKVFKNENTAFLRNLGFPESAGGLFFPKASTILVCWSKDKFKDDVVVCHEMLHYADQLLGGRMLSRACDENFAYSNSIKYLGLHGYTPKWVAEEYLLPYYWGIEVEKVRKEGERLTDGQIEAAKQAALGKCHAMAELELLGKREEETEEDVGRFDLI